jgi:catechol 2,3-dioxygenase-like lactoylglutathione lyase family enzyme
MYGSQHLNVSSVDAHMRFWIDTLGGSAGHAARSAGVVRFPNAVFLLNAQAPTGGTKGTTVNHIAFGVPDIRAIVAHVKASGYAIVTRAELPDRFEVSGDVGFIPALGTHVAFTLGPDDIKVEFLEDPRASLPIGLHHIHFFSPDADKMKAWYASTFGATVGDRGTFQAVDLPGGVNLTFSPTTEPVTGTRGRVLDRIGLRVSGLAAFSERLEASGVALSSNMLVDPWGTSIELSDAGPRPALASRA